MGKEKQDVTGSGFMKDALGRLVADENWIKDMWRKYGKSDE